MANKIGRLTNMVESSTGLPIELSLVDNGDGTYSLTTATPAGANVDIGAKADAAASTDTGTFSLIALFKRLLQKFTTQLPAALGGTTSAASFPVVLSSDGPFAIQTGAITETAPATDTAVYAAGDTVGTIITILNAFRVSGKEAILQSIHILDRSNQKPTGALLFFNASPAAATTTDNAAFVYSTDDLKEVARVPVAAADYVTVNGKATANLSNLGRQVYATTGTSLFVVFVTDGAPDFVATTDLQISYSFLRD